MNTHPWMQRNMAGTAASHFSAHVDTAAGRRHADPSPVGAAKGAFLVALLALAAFASHAARPLATDDAAVQGVGDCELDTYAGRALSRGEDASTAASTQLGCGILRGTYVGVAYARASSSAGSPQTVVLAGKTALQEAVEGVAGYAIGWGTVGKKIRGSSFRYDGWYATLSRTAGLSSQWTLHANLGAGYEHDVKAVTARWALAVERAFAGNWRGGIETFGDSRDRAPWVQAGASTDLPAQGLSINASWGTQLGSARNRLATAGITYDF